METKTSFMPAIDWLAAYDRSWLKADVVAGLTAGAIVIPKAMAYATIAGLPLQVGLYTAFLPMVVYALLGTSRVLSVSTTTTIAILGAAELGAVAQAHPEINPLTATATLAMLVGALLLIARLFRLGFVANFISDPVLTGFKAGIGLVIVVDQLPKLLGLHIHKEGFFRDLVAIAGQVPDTSLITLAITLGTFALIIGLEKFAPRAPAPLIAVAGGIAASALLGLQAHGVSIVGQIPGGFPSLTLPDLSLVQEMWPAAAGIALMSFTETIAAGRAFAHPGDPRTNSNQELVGIGAANVIGGLFGAMPAGGGTSQTAVNLNAGAQTQVAALITAAMAVATMLFLAPVMAAMPNATLAAVVIAYSVGLISPAEMAAIRRIRTIEFRWAIAACVGVMVLGTLNGILVAVIISMASLIHLANNPPLYVLGRKPGTHVFRPRSDEHPEDESFPGLLIVRTEGGMYFGNAPVVAEKLRALIAAEKPDVLLVDCGAIPSFEFTALKMLIDAEQRLRDQGITMWIAAVNPAALEMMRRTPLDETLGRERMFFTVEDAVNAYQKREKA
ncbi:SulP family inorganic anion transporter [Propionivibrio limicola]|uniref:SulP family inorganic anion transporter n=1 Tax=Propionivibrio limicola TaxID=167645 RepID=UPI00129122C7|nr:SulP family inorganic anion transporter [Propionivibrio limicola]